MKFHEFKTREELAENLAADVCDRLHTNIEAGDFASIALSGGGTPKLFLSKLGKLLGDHKQMVYFALVDERFVPPTDDRSNERMIREQLGIEAHAPTEFLSLYAENSTAEEVAKRAHARLLDDDEIPFDVVTLGMGLDGHTASFFPGGDNLSKAVDPKTNTLFETMTADGAGEPRITMTLTPLLSAKHLVLHIEGDEKRAVLEEALKDGDADALPVRHVLRQAKDNLHVYWAP